MPIKGLSEVRRLPRIGKIRLGVKEISSKSGSEYPRAVDYFVCNPDQTTSEAAAQAFHQVYGDKPRALDIMFPVEDRDIFFAQWYRRYGSGSGLLCKGDGETAMEIDRETGEIREIECCPEECEWVAKKHCRPVGTLQFLLYKVPGLGVWQIDTSSYHSIVNLNSGIDFIRSLAGGRIAMIPLRLVVKPQEVQVEGNKKVVYVLDLVHETARLEDILRASRQPVAKFLIPGANLDEMPDDLYPSHLYIDDTQRPSIEQPIEAQQQIEEIPKEQGVQKAQDSPRKITVVKLESPQKAKGEIYASEHKGEAQKPENGFWTGFWSLTRRLGLTPNQVHELAGVDSLKGLPVGWLQAFKAVFETMERLELSLDDLKTVLGDRKMPAWTKKHFIDFQKDLHDYAEAKQEGEKENVGN